ncbi:MAG: TRAM domain-containing protein [Salinarchaeum sp.]
MVDIPDSLRSLFTGTIEDRGDRYVIEVPASEVDHATLQSGETYRVAMLGQTGVESTTTSASPSTTESPTPTTRTPPVEEGETREVTIESLGDKGDGIAKVERGYVLIVPGARPGDEVTVEIEEVKENVAFAEPVKSDEPPV